MASHNASGKHSHIDITYDYSSSVLKRAIKPLLNDIGPSLFKYCPILSTLHLRFESYCDKCYAMKTSEENEYYLHLFQPHNYPCPNKNCSLHFVEQKHLAKHISICHASLLLTECRKNREKKLNCHFINFPKQIIANQPEKIVWITCYPNTSYCAIKLNHKSYCNDPKYIDPKHNPPIPIQQCYFHNIKNTCTTKPKLRRSLRLANKNMYKSHSIIIVQNIDKITPKRHKSKLKLSIANKPSIVKMLRMPPPLERLEISKFTPINSFYIPVLERPYCNYNYSNQVQILKTLRSEKINKYCIKKKKVKKVYLTLERKKNKIKKKKKIKNHQKICAKSTAELNKKQCKEWMSVDIDIDNQFDGIRSDLNCISNYSINRNYINSEWLHFDENMVNEMDDMCIRLDDIKLNKKYINLECPYCQIYVQCISLSDNKIGFICYNYPRCKYPLNCEEYQEKYIWDNVTYIGPYQNNMSNMSFAFGSQYKYMEWVKQQNILSEKLKERVNGKKLSRKQRDKQLSNEYNKFQKLNNENINMNCANRNNRNKKRKNDVSTQQTKWKKRKINT